MTLKEIAIKLLEKYEASKNVAICEYSTNINKDMDLLEKEVKKYRRMIENADRKTEPLKIELTVEDLQDWKDRMWAEAIVTEPTISKMEQVDRDINVRSKESE